MSFYENQHRARRNTSLLVGYFIAAVLLIIVAVNAVAFFLLTTLNNGQVMTPLEWVQSSACWVIAGATLAVITLGSLFRIASLSKGGISVALMAGGAPVSPDTTNERERTLINVTEEMAIASGVPVPRIFVLREEPGINAFVAGTQPGNTVLAVTQGTLDNLTRDELQGVIGHEFSHILNGDMLLNVRLIGILAGILLIGKLGEFLLRGERHRRSGNNKNGGQIALVGIALMVIGYVGLFFGRLIKASISRQREFLADASSVQFTRNPDGIAGALYAIGQHSGQSLLLNSHAEDMSHMCFGQTLKIRLGGMLATHPPLDSRIRAIDPRLIPIMKDRWRKRQRGESIATASTTTNAASAMGFAGAIPAAAGTAATIKASVGSPTPAHTEFAQQLHAAMPQGLQDAAHDPARAAALLYALLLTEMRSHGKEAMDLLAAEAGEAAAQDAGTLYRLVAQQDLALRLPLLDILLATLRSLETAAQERILATSDKLIRIDNKVTLSEFIITYLVRNSLQPRKGLHRSIKSYASIKPALATLFSALVQSSGNNKEQQAESFNQVMQTFSGANGPQALLALPTPKQMTAALDQLSRLTPLLKQPVVDSCVDCVLFDGKASLRELEILRAICDALECPMPPLQATLSSRR